MRTVTGYVHDYGTPEQERLVAQAEHWRHRLIRDGTRLEPGSSLLEVGCGAGAVLAVLGQEFPGVHLTGVDIEQRQLDFARGHLEQYGVEATLVEADALALPFGDESFDHVWMMWFLEHVADPVEVLREARRVLVEGGDITAIEVDYSTCRAEPSTPALEALIRAMVQGMAASGWSDAGTAAGLAPRSGLPRCRRRRAALLVAGRRPGGPGELRLGRDRERAPRCRAATRCGRAGAARGARGSLHPPGQARRGAWLGRAQVDGSAGRLAVGDSADAFVGPGLLNPSGAEIHLMVRDHGLADPAILTDQFKNDSPRFCNVACAEFQKSVHLPDA